MPTRSAAPSAPEILAGPVAVCIDRPILALDTPFTYDLPAELGAGVGSLVRVRFHGKLTRGWVLGSTDDIPARMLPVTKLVSPVRAFDGSMLQLYRWMSERYVAPLATVIGRGSPPRVASEEGAYAAGAGVVPGGAYAAGAGVVPGGAPLLARAARAPEPPGPSPGPTAPRPSLWSGYSRGAELRDAIASPSGGAFVVRPSPGEEVALAVEAVSVCLSAGRRALVLVPDASPVPATAVAIREAFGDRVCVFLGGDKRSRYRTWLEIAAGAFEVVVSTRPGVFAPLERSGLIYVSRESHPGHREERAPYYHVRDVALARARLAAATAVLAAACPTSEAAALDLPDVVPAHRRWPKVEVVRPGREGKAPRLLQALATARRGFVLAAHPGYGVAQVCRSCGSPAACAACGGVLRLEDGEVRCVVCEAPGRCARCGSTDLGIRKGGRERVEEWASRAASVAVHRMATPRLPGDREIVIGGPEDVRDLGPGGLDLVAVLDADQAGVRPGLSARERALAVWMEAVGWAVPDGRAIVQASEPGDPAVQALVRGNPDRFHERERTRREQAGFPVGAPVFRVMGDDRLGDEVEALRPLTSLISELGGRTVCLLALQAERVPAFGRSMRTLAARGVVERVEAEPHL